MLFRSSPAVALAREIVRDYFDVFSLMHYDQLRSMLGVTENELKQAVDVIRSLNPKPGAQISGGEDDRTNHITHDFLVETEGALEGVLSMTSATIESSSPKYSLLPMPLLCPVRKKSRIPRVVAPFRYLSRLGRATRCRVPRSEEHTSELQSP